MKVIDFWFYKMERRVRYLDPILLSEGIRSLSEDMEEFPGEEEIGCADHSWNAKDFLGTI